MNKQTEQELLPAERQHHYDASAKTAVALRAEQPLAVANAPQELNLQTIADRILTGELTSEKLAMIKDLVAMDSERKFSAAFSAMQAELPIIVASTPVKNRGSYEKFEDVMRQVQPCLDKHGFSVSFSQDFNDTRIIETCHLSHIGGHSRKSSFAVRVARADSETQSDVKAATTAKRKALQDALNIVIRQDCLNEEYDATLEGDPNAFVTAAQADELERRAKMTDSKIPQFLEFAGAKKFSEIPANRYEELDRILRGKERGR